MKYASLVLSVVFASGAAGVARGGIIDLETAMSPKIYSPNRAYAMWPTEFVFDDSPSPGSPPYFALVISGPYGPKTWGPWRVPTRAFRPDVYGVLITDSGTAVMSHVSETPDPSLLWVFDYAHGSEEMCESNRYFFPNYGGEFRDPGNPWIWVEAEIDPLRLTDRALTAQVTGYVGGSERFSELVRWDLTKQGNCRLFCGEPTVIPEPGTYLTMVSGLALLAVSRRIPRRRT